MSLSLLWNSLVSGYYSIISWFPTHVFGSVKIYDWIHDPKYEMELSTTIPESALQIYARDVQANVKIYQDETGAVVGYIAADTYIDVTDVIAHVTLEGNIVIWGPDSDPLGIWCVIWPYNTQINHVLVDGSAVSVSTIPEASPSFDMTNTWWPVSDKPNHWVFVFQGVTTSQADISIDVKYDTTANHIPYVDTTWWAQNVSRYDHKQYMPGFFQNGTDIGVFDSISPPKLSSSEHRRQIDRAAWVISVLKHKYSHEPTTFANFRRSAELIV